MQQESLKLIRPLGVFREGLGLWWRNLVPLATIQGARVLLGLLMQGTVKMFEGGSQQVLFIVVIIEGCLLFALNAFLLLTIFSFFAEPREGKRFFIKEALTEARSKVFSFAGTALLLGGFVALLLFVAHSFWGAGTLYYARLPVASAGGLGGTTLAILIALHIPVVVFFIAAIWYGFFFSLGPLVAAFEKKPPLASFRESKIRLKVNGLRYLAVLVLSAALYFGSAILIALLLNLVWKDPNLFLIADPFFSTVIGSLGPGLWFVCYRKLTEESRE